MRKTSQRVRVPAKGPPTKAVAAGGLCSYGLLIAKTFALRSSAWANCCPEGPGGAPCELSNAPANPARAYDLQERNLVASLDLAGASWRVDVGDSRSPGEPPLLTPMVASVRGHDVKPKNWWEPSLRCATTPLPNPIGCRHVWGDLPVAARANLAPRARGFCSLRFQRMEVLAHRTTPQTQTLQSVETQTETLGLQKNQREPQ